MNYQSTRKQVRTYLCVSIELYRGIYMGVTYGLCMSACWCRILVVVSAYVRGSSASGIARARVNRPVTA